MFTFSTKLIDSLMDDGWDTVFTTPVMEIRAGTRPASADDAVVGDLLCTINPPDTGYFAATSGGVKQKSGTWTGTVSAGGTPTWFRIKNSSDTGGASTTDPRLDGDTGDSGGYDLMLGALPLVATDTLNVDNFTISWAGSVLIAEAFAGVTHEAAMALGGSATMTPAGTV